MGEERDVANEPDLTGPNLTDELVDAISGPVGFIVINWAMIEKALVGQIEAVGHIGPSMGINVTRQKAFNDRFKTMRRLLNGLPQLASYKAQALALLQETKNLQPLRDLIAHGSLQAFLPEEGFLIFNRLRPAAEKDGHDLSQEMVTVEDLQKAVFYIAEVRRKMEILANSLMEEFGRD